MNQNISQQSAINNRLPASMAPISVTKAQITGLVSWVTQERKVSWLEASMAYEVETINAVIKLGLIALKDNYLILAGLAEQVVEHANTHLTQVSNHYVETCNYFEELPKPSITEIFTTLFGEGSIPLTNEDRRQITLRTQNKHAQIRAEVEAEELAQLEAQKQAQQLAQQKVLHTNRFAESFLADEPDQTDETQIEQTGLKVFPMFRGLKLKNSDRAEKDTYLLYVGNRADCVRAATQCNAGSVRINSKDGHSWKFVLPIEHVFNSSTNIAFNFQNYAKQSVDSYKQSKKADHQQELFQQLAS